MTGFGSRLLVLGLALALAPTASQALSYSFESTFLSGAANVSGTITIADPFDGVANIIAFSLTERRSGRNPTTRAGFRTRRRSSSPGRPMSSRSR